MNEKNTLNVLNGQSMHEYFKQHHLDKNGAYIPFNEAMCAGEAAIDIFSDYFIECRCNAHHVTMEQYNEITLKPLEALFKNKFSDIVLWFDDDMFCQINLLTLLAYLEQTNYGRSVTFNLVNRKFKVVGSYYLQIKGYFQLYRKVMIDRSMPEKINNPLLENGIKLYLEYIKEESEITAYIRQHIGLENNILLLKLFEVFQQYGLGDTQYMQLIERCRVNMK